MVDKAELPAQLLDYNHITYHENRCFGAPTLPHSQLDCTHLIVNNINYSTVNCHMCYPQQGHVTQ